MTNTNSTDAQTVIQQGVEINQLLREIDSLKSLAEDMIHALNMASYDVEDPSKSHLLEVNADQFSDRFLSIIRSEPWVYFPKATL